MTENVPESPAEPKRRQSKLARSIGDIERALDRLSPEEQADIAEQAIEPPASPVVERIRSILARHDEHDADVLRLKLRHVARGTGGNKVSRGGDDGE